jgi:hypothetical protein
VAVAYDSKNYREITVSLVHIYMLLSVLEEEKLISSILSRKIIHYTKTIYWFERYWDLLIEGWQEKFNLSNIVINRLLEMYLDHKYHPKKRDAKMAINLINSKRWSVHK